jgi:hypothetical protein
MGVERAAGLVNRSGSVNVNTRKEEFRGVTGHMMEHEVPMLGVWVLGSQSRITWMCMYRYEKIFVSLSTSTFFYNMQLI